MMKCANSQVKVKKDVAEYERIKKRLKGNKSVSVKLPNFKTMEVKKGATIL